MAVFRRILALVSMIVFIVFTNIILVGTVGFEVVLEFMIMMLALYIVKDHIKENGKWSLWKVVYLISNMIMIKCCSITTNYNAPKNSKNICSNIMHVTVVIICVLTVQKLWKGFKEITKIGKGV